MDIRFYTGDGKLTHICADFVRVTWQDCLKAEGLSEITVLKDHKLSDIVTNTPVLIAKYGKNQGIVCGYRFEGEYLFITVKSLLTLLTRRVVMGTFGEEELSFSGNPLEIICDKILPFAEYISFKGEIKEVASKSITLECGTDLLDAANQLLAGTSIGMKIEFEPKTASYFLSFLYPKEHLIRLSEGNRNLVSVSAAKDLTAVQNSGYYNLPFYEPVDWDHWENYDLVKNYNPDNFLKQFKILYDVEKDGISFVAGKYAYCDTKDGALKISDTPKTLSTQYISLEQNPVLIFQGDFRKYDEQESMALLEIRKYISEKWNAKPIYENPLAVGTVVMVEKEVGSEKGLKKLQVISVKTDTKEPLPHIELA